MLTPTNSPVTWSASASGDLDDRRRGIAPIRLTVLDDLLARPT
jgi:hypothetical protein